jgi:hypothetical protein
MFEGVKKKKAEGNKEKKINQNQIVKNGPLAQEKSNFRMEKKKR